jgi:hypothetical protein
MWVKFKLTHNEIEVFIDLFDWAYGDCCLGAARADSGTQGGADAEPAIAL